MRYNKVYLDTIGYELAPIVVTSAELEKRVESVYRALRVPPGQLEMITGIIERRWWEPGFLVSDGAIAAAQKCLAKSTVTPEDIEVLIYAGVCREGFEPATACRVAHHIGVSPSADVFDVGNACLGVMNGIVEVANRIELGQIRAGLVVSCETAREIVESTIERLSANPNMELFKLTIATLTGGSGAVATLITDGSFTDDRQPRLIGGVSRNAPRFHDLCRWRVDHDPATPWSEIMTTDSVAVLNNGVALGERTWQAFLKEMRWTKKSIDRVICHQVGSKHQEKILQQLQISPDKDYVTHPYLGNIGTVSLPITAALAHERGVLEPGQQVGFLGIGSGLNCMMLGWEW
ncbi:MAG: 3-oxoacyl-ACP synthase III [Candidatus Cloacimonetes bacterium 4572_55]|nr:MAG: 3-oxoacyl-ACP synthase III [Candidatus Cloacimonetes bacterium 4572_55]